MPLAFTQEDFLVLLLLSRQSPCRIVSVRSPCNSLHDLQLLIQISGAFVHMFGGRISMHLQDSFRVATLQLIPNSLCFPCALAIFPVFFC